MPSVCVIYVHVACMYCVLQSCGCAVLSVGTVLSVGVLCLVWVCCA